MRNITAIALLASCIAMLGIGVVAGTTTPYTQNVNANVQATTVTMSGGAFGTTWDLIPGKTDNEITTTATIISNNPVRGWTLSAACTTPLTKTGETPLADFVPTVTPGTGNGPSGANAISIKLVQSVGDYALSGDYAGVVTYSLTY
jgi:hypothetical protein